MERKRKKRRGGKRKKSMLCESLDWCSICGLRMAYDLVSVTSRHALFGTIDHVIPLSKGGKDNAANRRPAHSVCNRIKGNRIEVTPGRTINIQGIVKRHFAEFGVVITDKELAQARRRIGIMWPTKTERQIHSFESSWDCIRWESDGGFVGVSIET